MTLSLQEPLASWQRMRPHAWWALVMPLLGSSSGSCGRRRAPTGAMLPSHAARCCPVCRRSLGPPWSPCCRCMGIVGVLCRHCLVLSAALAALEGRSISAPPAEGMKRVLPACCISQALVPLTRAEACSLSSNAGTAPPVWRVGGGCSAGQCHRSSRPHHQRQRCTALRAATGAASGLPCASLELTNSARICFILKAGRAEAHFVFLLMKEGVAVLIGQAAVRHRCHGTLLH